MRLRDSILRWYVATPEHPMKYRVVRWLGRNCFPAQGVKAEVPPGVKLFLHPQDWLEYWLLSKHDYEPLTLNFIAQNLKAGDRAVFAGVNFGLHVIVAARAVGPTGKILGIEPQPAALLKARQHLQLNGVSEQVELVSVALGADEGFAHMAWSGMNGNEGAASLLDEGLGFAVRLARISQVLRDFGAERAQLILLDVEGYEVNVLKGLAIENAPNLIIVEVQPEFLRRAGTSESELLKMLRAFGYQLYTLCGLPVAEACGDLPEKNLVGVRERVEVAWTRP